MPPQALAGSAYARTAKDLDENMQLLGLDQVAKPKPKPKRNPKPKPKLYPKPEPMPKPKPKPNPDLVQARR